MTQSDLANQIQHDVKVSKLIEGLLVLGMNKKQAALYAGFSYSHAKDLLKTPEVIEEMQVTSELIRKKYHITRDRVVKGMVDAAERAKMLGEPNTELNCWKELGKLHGLYEPTQHRVIHSADEEELSRRIEEMPREELLKLAAQKKRTPAIIEGEVSKDDS